MLIFFSHFLCIMYTEILAAALAILCVYLSRSKRADTSLKFKGHHVIVIDGLIGAGKSTLVKNLATHYRRTINPRTKTCYRVAEAQEPVSEWIRVGILARFYRDIKEAASTLCSTTYEFQTYTFVTRIKAVRDALQAVPDADIFIVERSVLTDRYIFMKLQQQIVGKERMMMYNEFFDLFATIMPFDLLSAHFVYLRTDVTKCMSRLMKRGREEEIAGVSFEYQKQLIDAHEELFSRTKNKESPLLTHVTTINSNLANEDYSDINSDAFKSILHHIESG